MKKNVEITPRIVTNVISKCDDLINQSMKRELNRFNNLIESYQAWLSKFELNHKFTYGPIISFLQNISGKYRVGGTVEYRMLSFSFPDRNVRVFNQEMFNKWFDKYIEEYKANQIWKLTQSMTKHLTNKNILSSDVKVSKSVKGFCVDFQYLDEGDLLNYHTEAIDAGGHNIQCYHYRYITKIKKVTT